MRGRLLRVLAHQQHAGMVRRTSASGAGAGTALLLATRSTADKAPAPGQSIMHDDDGVKSGPVADMLTGEEDPVEVLRRIQQESKARAASLRGAAPPAPERRSGKTQFFDADQGSQEEAIAHASPRAAAAAAAPTRPVGRVVPRAAQGGKPPGAPTAGSGPLAGRKTTASAAAALGKDGKTRTDNAFMAKLDEMETESKSPTFPTYDAAAERRRRHIEEKIKEERKHLLVFRDVGMDLDKPILSRDVFLVFKYFRYGAEFAVDNELERQLRYFNEHAVNELKIIQDSKLMRGPPTLAKKRHGAAKRSVFSAPGGGGGSTPSATASGVSTAAGGVLAPDGRAHGSTNLTSSNPSAAAAFQVTSSFPHVRCANLLQYCAPFDSKYRAVLQGLLRPSAAQSTFAPYLLGKGGSGSGGDGGAAPPKFDASSEEQMTTLSPSSFRRPALVIYSQLGQKFGTECDEAWRRLAYTTICPGIVPYLPADPASPAATLASSSSSSSGAAAKHKSSPIDVISLRSADLYKYRWVHALYVRRLAKTLREVPLSSASAAPDGAGGGVSDAVAVRNLLTAATTFVGPRLLEPFYATLGLRNYLLPQAMLVDHDGVVRWLSGGLPDAYEAEHFPVLLKQLENEYYGAKRAS